MPQPSIFDSFERTDVGRKLRSESVFKYLNRSAEKAAGCFRDLVEAWYAGFPAEGKADVRGRLRSGEAVGFDSAFHELCLHGLLTGFGLTAELHPVLPGSTRTPDFLVHDDTHGDFYLEAVAPTDVADKGARQRAATLLDGLDTKMEDPNYWLSISVEQYSSENGSPKSFRRFVETALESLPAIAAGLPQQLEPRRFEYKEGDWIIEFAGFPKPEVLRGTGRLGAIGLELSPFHDIKVDERLRAAMETKAKKYGELGLAYIIAVNTNDLFGDEHQLLMALFGVGATPLRKGTTQLVPPVRLRHDGLWIKGDTPRNTQVSGVLFTRKISAANLGSSSATLYLNPWARFPYDGLLRQLSAATFTRDAFEYDVRGGQSLLHVLQLEAGWPFWPTEIEEDPTPTAGPYPNVG